MVEIKGVGVSVLVVLVFVFVLVLMWVLVLEVVVGLRYIITVVGFYWLFLLLLRPKSFPFELIISLLASSYLLSSTPPLPFPLSTNPNKHSPRFVTMTTDLPITSFDYVFDFDFLNCCNNLLTAC